MLVHQDSSWWVQQARQVRQWEVAEVLRMGLVGPLRSVTPAFLTQTVAQTTCSATNIGGRPQNASQSTSGVAVRSTVETIAYDARQVCRVIPSLDWMRAGVPNPIDLKGRV